MLPTRRSWRQSIHDKSPRSLPLGSGETVCPPFRRHTIHEAGCHPAETGPAGTLTRPQHAGQKPGVTLGAIGPESVVTGVVRSAGRPKISSESPLWDEPSQRPAETVWPARAGVGQGLVRSGRCRQAPQAKDDDHPHATMTKERHGKDPIKQHDSPHGNTPQGTKGNGSNDRRAMPLGRDPTVVRRNQPAPKGSTWRAWRWSHRLLICSVWSCATV